MYNLIEYSDNYLKTSGNVWQYYKDWTFIGYNGNIFGVPDDPDSTSFTYKQKVTGQTGNNGTKDVQIVVPLNCLSIFGELLKCH